MTWRHQQQEATVQRVLAPKGHPASPKGPQSVIQTRQEYAAGAQKRRTSHSCQASPSPLLNPLSGQTPGPEMGHPSARPESSGQGTSGSAALGSTQQLATAHRSRQPSKRAPPPGSPSGFLQVPQSDPTGDGYQSGGAQLPARTAESLRVHQPVQWLPQATSHFSSP
ncbi:hypothetical protein NDU88_005635 [Pleurodeles waltl]|uniref:Uncharacterized protein n=1 Tax=Pleurodeles waltl TaxID=8319 RepID=A0AAV7QGI9_PLEWA|nr:hypothetical protein NDU88_005635 [Pleurodeles waltl]